MIRWLLIAYFAVFAACSKTVYLSETTIGYERISDVESADSDDINQLIIPYRQKLSAIMDREIGVLEVEMVKERPESNIGNWLADMLYEEAREANNGVLDFAVQNHGGIRINGLGKGPITIGEIYEVMPFDNLVSIISADGRIIQEFLDHIAKSRGWPVSKGLNFKIKNEKATDILLNGAPLDLNRIYHFALPDYIASGGGGTFMLADVARRDLNLLVRDAFIRHIEKDRKNGIQQSARKEGRIVNLDRE